MKKDDIDHSKILKMPYRSKISDAEITSLFLGLCRIVKEKAKEEVKCTIYNNEEKNMQLCKEIVKKNKEIEMLRMINYQLKKRIDEHFLKLKPNNLENV